MASHRLRSAQACSPAAFLAEQPATPPRVRICTLKVKSRDATLGLMAPVDGGNEAQQAS